MLRRAPVCDRTRRWPSVTSAKIIRATALPIDAIADRSKARTITRITTAATSRPTGARSASRRPMTGGNWPVDARCSHKPGGRIETRVRRAGRREERRDGHQRSSPASPSTGWAATAIAVGPAAMTSATVSVPNTPRDDRDVDDRREPDGDRHRPRQLSRRIGEVLGGERHDAEAEEREERERDARHDVA